MEYFFSAWIIDIITYVQSHFLTSNEESIASQWAAIQPHRKGTFITKTLQNWYHQSVPLLLTSSSSPTNQPSALHP